jgi:hypothetical protein
METPKYIADFSSALEAVTNALDATRAQLASVNAEIDRKTIDRAAIERKQPHTDDIVAVFLRGIDVAAQDFEAHLEAELTARFVGNDGKAAAAVDEKKASSIVRLEQAQLSREAKVTRAMTSGTADINASVLTYLLRDKIAEEIPSLVERLCPASRNGIKSVDRMIALQEIDDRIAELTEERDALQSNLQAAMQAVRRQPNN